MGITARPAGAYQLGFWSNADPTPTQYQLTLKGSCSQQAILNEAAEKLM